MPKKLQTQRVSDLESSVLIGRLMREEARESAKQLKKRVELHKKGMDDAQRRRETIEYRRILSERLQALIPPDKRQPPVAPAPEISQELEHKRSLAQAAKKERAARRAKENARLARKTDRQRRKLRRLRVKQLAMALARSTVLLRGRRRPTAGRRVAGRGNSK